MRLALMIVVGAVVGLLLARMSCHEGSARQHQNLAGPPTERRTAPLHVPATMATVPQRELQASDRRYDPLLLLKESNGELTPKEVFEGEPRDPAFAPILERRQHTALDTALRELGFDDKEVHMEIECKTLSCGTRIEIAKQRGQRLYDALNGVMFGDLQEPGINDSDPDHTYVTLTNLYRPESRDENRYNDFFNAATRPSLDAAKQRLAKAPDEAPR